MITSYKQLEVWKRSQAFVVAVYAASRGYPKEEMFGLTSQLRRAAVSVLSNIAEGNCRNSRRDYAHFISIARGSIAEVETLLLLSIDLQYGSRQSLHLLLNECEEIGKMLNRLHSSLCQPR